MNWTAEEILEGETLREENTPCPECGLHVKSKGMVCAPCNKSLIEALNE